MLITQPSPVYFAVYFSLGEHSNLRETKDSPLFRHSSRMFSDSLKMIFSPARHLFVEDEQSRDIDFLSLALIHNQCFSF